MPSKSLPKAKIKFPHIKVYKIGDLKIPKKKRVQGPTNFQRTHFFKELEAKFSEGFGVSELLDMEFTAEVKKHYGLTKPNAMRHIQRSVDEYVRRLGYGPEYVVNKREANEGTTHIQIKHVPVIQSMNRGAIA